MRAAAGRSCVELPVQSGIAGGDTEHERIAWFEFDCLAEVLVSRVAVTDTPSVERKPCVRFCKSRIERQRPFAASRDSRHPCCCAGGPLSCRASTHLPGPPMRARSPDRSPATPRNTVVRARRHPACDAAGNAGQEGNALAPVRWPTHATGPDPHAGPLAATSERSPPSPGPAVRPS